MQRIKETNVFSEKQFTFIENTIKEYFGENVDTLAREFQHHDKESFFLMYVQEYDIMIGYGRRISISW